MLDEGGTYNSAAFLGFDVCSLGIRTPNIRNRHIYRHKKLRSHS